MLSIFPFHQPTYNLNIDLGAMPDKKAHDDAHTQFGFVLCGVLAHRYILVMIHFLKLWCSDCFACCVAGWVLSFVEQLVSILWPGNLLKLHMSSGHLILLCYLIILFTLKGATSTKLKNLET